MNRTIEIDEIVSLTDIAKMFNVNQSAVSNWAVRHTNFPAPFKIVSKTTRLYRRSEVLAWYAKHEKLDASELSARIAALQELLDLITQDEERAEHDGSHPH